MSTVVNGGAGRAGTSPRTVLSTQPATAHRPGRPRRGARLRRALTPYVFVAPVLVGIAVFLIYPLLSSVYFSFTRFNIAQTPEWIGLANWEFLLSDDKVLLAAKNTLWLVVVMVPARMLGALGTALLVNQIRRARGFYRTLFYLPALAPPVAATIAFVLLLKPGTGPVNTLLEKIGVSDPPLWFNDPDWAKPALVLLALWGVGDLMIIFVAALLDVPVELHEAAALDGAGVWARFRYITLPTISPVLLFAAITGIIATLQYFTQAAVAASVASGQVTGGSGIAGTFGYPSGSTFTYPLWLYVIGFNNGLLGYANVLALVLFAVSITATLILLRRFKSFIGGR